VLLSYNKNVTWWYSSALNLRYLCVSKIAAYQNERGGDVIEIEITQVSHILTATEHAEGPLKISSRKQYKCYLSALHNISESEAWKRIVKAKRSKITNRNPSTSEENPSTRKIGTWPKCKTYITVCQLYHSFFKVDIVYCSFKDWYRQLEQGNSLILLK